MDGVDGDDAAFAKAPEGAEDDGSAGGEGDGAVEGDGGLVVFCADPGCSGGCGLLAVVFAAGGDVRRRSSSGGGLAMAWLAEAPKPKRPTRSPGWVPATRRLRKPMMPAQRSGATWVLSRVAGSG